VLVTGVHHQRDPILGAVRKPSLQNSERLLGVVERNKRQLSFFRIVIEIYMLAGQHFPVEVIVLDLVLAKTGVLGLGGIRGEKGQSEKSSQARGDHEGASIRARLNQE
jgi:hypothetical protein